MPDQSKPTIDTKKPLRIGNCSGFYGDRLAAAREMLEGGPLDYLTGDYLAELTMLILFKSRMKDPTKGYAVTFLKQMEQVGGTPDQFAVYAWDATLAFAEAAKAVVAKQGVNGITRSSFIDGLESLTAFNAGGMAGTHSFATQKPSPCFVAMRFVGGKWARQYPAKAGTFDCKVSNGITFKADLID